MDEVTPPTQVEKPASTSGTPTFISGAALWKEIQRLSRLADGPKRVATAYLGDGAGERIALGVGDKLLTALCEANVKNGTVCPFELRRLKQLGAKVFLDPNLHAKVYHFGNAAAVGSANLSKSSTSLLEAAMVTSDATRLTEIAKWFDDACTTEVTDAHLDHLEPLFVGSRGGARASAGRHEQPRLWLVGIHSTDFPDSESEEYQEGAKRAEAKVANPADVESLRFTAGSKFFREVKADDLLIQVFKPGSTLEVYPHAVVLDAHRIGDDGALYIHIQEFTEPAIRWTAFRKEMEKVGLKLKKKVGSRLIGNQPAVDRAKKLTMVRT